MINLDKIFNRTAMIYGAIVTVMTALFGKYWFLFVGFFALTILDYITGYLKAKMHNEYSSKKGREGVYKKFGNFAAIAVAFFTAYLLNQIGVVIGVDLKVTVLMGWYTLAVFMINEIDSIIENLDAMGVVIPKFLLKGMNTTIKVMNETIEDSKKNDSGDNIYH